MRRTREATAVWFVTASASAPSTTDEREKEEEKDKDFYYVITSYFDNFST